MDAGGSALAANSRWIEKRSKSRDPGRAYYYNAITHERRWTPPPALVKRSASDEQSRPESISSGQSRSSSDRSRQSNKKSSRRSPRISRRSPASYGRSQRERHRSSRSNSREYSRYPRPYRRSPRRSPKMSRWSPTSCCSSSEKFIRSPEAFRQSRERSQRSPRASRRHRSLKSELKKMENPLVTKGEKRKQGIDDSIDFADDDELAGNFGEIDPCINKKRRTSLPVNTIDPGSFSFKKLPISVENSSAPSTEVTPMDYSYILVNEKTAPSMEIGKSGSQNEVEAMEVDEIVNEVKCLREDTETNWSEPLPAEYGYIDDNVTANWIEHWETDLEIISNNDIVVVVDTNILLDDLRFLNDLLDKPDPVCIVVPYVVLHELDRLKSDRYCMKRGHKLSLPKKARAANEWLSKKLKACNMFVQPSYADQKAIPGIAIACNDDRVLKCAVEITQRRNAIDHRALTILCTNDKNLGIKGKVNHVQSATKTELKELLLSMEGHSNCLPHYGSLPADPNPGIGLGHDHGLGLGPASASYGISSHGSFPSCASVAPYGSFPSRDASPSNEFIPSNGTVPPPRFGYVPSTYPTTAIVPPKKLSPHSESLSGLSANTGAPSHCSQISSEAENLIKACRSFLSAVAEKEMRTIYDDLWTDIVKIKPPWTELREVLDVFMGHWMAVFHWIFPQKSRRRTKEILQSLQAVVKCSGQSGNATTLSDRLRVLLHLLQFLKALSHRESVNCRSLMQKIEQTLSPNAGKK